jgi:hypothetical protein
MPQKDLRIAYGAAPEQIPSHGPDLTETKNFRSLGPNGGPGLRQCCANEIKKQHRFFKRCCFM